MRAELHRLVGAAAAAHPGARVLLTGHSLGGAQALLAAADLPAAFPARSGPRALGRLRRRRTPC